MSVSGQIVHQVGLPYHWGYKGLVKGGAVNDLVAISEEPNVRIMETKALVCNLKRGRSRNGSNGSGGRGSKNGDSTKLRGEIAAQDGVGHHDAHNSAQGSDLESAHMEKR